MSETSPPNAFDPQREAGPNDNIPTAPAVPSADLKEILAQFDRTGDRGSFEQLVAIQEALKKGEAPKPPAAVKTWEWWQGGAVVSGGVVAVSYIAKHFNYQLPEMETGTFVGAVVTAVAALVALCLKAKKITTPAP